MRNGVFFDFLAMPILGNDQDASHFFEVAVVMASGEPEAKVSHAG